MKDICTRDKARDFRQRYAQTVGFYCKDGVKKCVYIQDVTDDQVVFVDRGGTPYVSVNDQPGAAEFEFTQVPTGWFNTSNGPMYVFRVPARQYQRGIAAANTRIMDSTLRTKGFTLKLVEDIFTYKKEWDGSFPWAFNKFFCMNANKTLLFFDTKCAILEDNTLKLPKNSALIQEVRDLVSRFKLPYNVMVEE